MALSQTFQRLKADIPAQAQGYANAEEILKDELQPGFVKAAWDGGWALAEAIKQAPKMGKDKIILVNLSGRGDKDCNEIAALLERRKK